MRLLVIRTSAMGDVALTTPVLAAIRKQYPEIEVLLLTKLPFKPFFTSIQGLTLFFTDYKVRHKGILGLLRLFTDLRSGGKVDAVIDLHDVLRSKILRILFRFSGAAVFVIDKGRSEKKSVIRGNTKSPLKHSVERYKDVFSNAGFPVFLSSGPWIAPSTQSLAKVSQLFSENNVLNIGIAPYAKHKLKMWPEEYMLRLIELIKTRCNAKFWLFGGMEELERLSAFQQRISGSINVVGTLNLDEELALISKLDLMIAMDSSNMHMAAMVGTKVISIWGGTDPLSGFGAWMQPSDFSIRISTEELTCRPCTTFGKGECRRGDFACMNWLTPELVYQKIEKLKIWQFKT
jgi:ADP-heptose:LPS heptosyltransferase